MVKPLEISTEGPGAVDAESATLDAVTDRLVAPMIELHDQPVVEVTNGVAANETHKQALARVMAHCISGL